VLRLPQKGTNFENCQNWKKKSEKSCFLRLFQKFFNLGAILAHQITNGVFSGSWRIFWHPWHPWGRVNSGDISFLIFVFDFSVWQRHLAEFFHYSQIEARCHLYGFGMFKSDNITFHSQNGWIFKVIQAASVVIWMESELISPVWSNVTVWQKRRGEFSVLNFLMSPRF
jgi:hypothetical protein